MDPRPAGVQWDEISVHIHKMNGAAKPGRFFVFAVGCRPVNFEGFSVAEQVGKVTLPIAEIHFELIVTESHVLGKDNDHVLERQLTPGQAICFRKEDAFTIGVVSEAQVCL